jgi:hypothetical protein
MDTRLRGYDENIKIPCDCFATKFLTKKAYHEAKPRHPTQFLAR